MRSPIGTDVAWSMCLCVCLLVTITNCAKTAEPIEMLFGVWTRVGPRNYVPGGKPDPQWKGQFSGQLPAHGEVYGTSDVSQCYSLGGSSDAAFRCQYCINLLLLSLLLSGVDRALSCCDCLSVSCCCCIDMDIRKIMTDVRIRRLCQHASRPKSSCMNVDVVFVYFCH